MMLAERIAAETTHRWQVVGPSCRAAVKVVVCGRTVNRSLAWNPPHILRVMKGIPFTVKVAAIYAGGPVEDQHATTLQDLRTSMSGNMATTVPQQLHRYSP